MRRLWQYLVHGPPRATSFADDELSDWLLSWFMVVVVIGALVFTIAVSW